jgi:hypothetical protein
MNKDLVEETKIFSKTKIFSVEEKKSLANRIEKLPKKEDFVNLFKIINREMENNFTVNKNGLFIDISLLSQAALEKVDKFVNQKVKDQPQIQYTFLPYSNDEFLDINTLGPKLSNKEKSIIKRFRASESEDAL